MAEMVGSSPSTMVSGRVRRARGVVLGMLCVTGVINYLDRSTLAVANPLIAGELGLSPTQMGALI